MRRSTAGGAHCIRRSQAGFKSGAFAIVFLRCFLPYRSGVGGQPPDDTRPAFARKKVGDRGAYQHRRSTPLVRDGIFRFTPNAMYVFGLGALWIPAFALQSTAALIGAAFSHAYIWVHYLTVEGPDMRRIYQ
jgi:hypothetical protein